MQIDIDLLKSEMASKQQHDDMRVERLLKQALDEQQQFKQVMEKFIATPEVKAKVLVSEKQEQRKKKQNELKLLKQLEQEVKEEKEYCKVCSVCDESCTKEDLFFKESEDGRTYTWDDGYQRVGDYMTYCTRCHIIVKLGNSTYGKQLLKSHGFGE